MEIGISSPNEKEKAMQMKQYEASAGPLAPRKPGVGEQMGDMAKQRAMKGALDAGQEGIMKGISGMGTAAPSTTQMAGLESLAGTSGAGLSPGAAQAVLGSGTQAAPLVAEAAGMTSAGLAGTTGTGLATSAGTSAAAAGAGAGGMAALGTAVPYIGAAMLADQALGLGIMDSLFSEGGKVGPLSPQYKAEGTMSEEQAMALMNNQPEPMTEIAQEAIPMISPDPLMAMPTPRPSPEKMYLHNNPYDAAMIYEGYDPILDTVATPTPRPAEYKFGGGPLGMGVLGMYQDMMKKNMR
jgi:hypothetical protein